MNECIDQGLFVAYTHKSDLTQQEQIAVEEHLAGCPACREQLQAWKALDGRVEGLLATLAPTAPAEQPDIQSAWARMQSRLAAEQPASSRTYAAQLQNITGASDTNALQEARRLAEPNRSKSMQSTIIRLPGVRRALFGGMAAVLALGLVASPSLRAAADGILQVFRVQSTVFLPVDAARLQQLASLNFDTSSLFLSAPQVSEGGLKRSDVASVAEAAKEAGFQPEQIGSLPGKPDTVDYSVYSSAHISATLNVDALRNVLSMLNIQDVTLPDALSQAPITAELPPSIMTTYSGVNYTLRLVEGRSPNVTMPPGVMLSDLGAAGLRVLGMDAAQAAQMSKQIDWTSTLVVPFPSSLNAVKQVQIGSVQGLLVQSGQSILLRQSSTQQDSTMLYWQQGDHFYVLVGDGPGMNENVMLNAARTMN